ncbi:ZIP Zinc transporter [Loa loa]|uniref:ZIP Zinc transporter n=1 Tax=Loa loa TaxID=7209 RepID=A0A1S0TXM7_LOALO|nr:ZIP Zinc transporter [Loa loa]EFO21805.2 ZIP Zinc transporter [Loa loa]
MVIVTVATFASPSCILFVPLLKKKLYERVMTFLVALGIGALSGSAFEVREREGLVKSLIVLGSLYSFFAVDRILQFAMEIKRRRKSRKVMEIDKINKKDFVTTLSKPTSRRNSHSKDEIEQIKAEIESAAVNSAITRTFSTSKKVPVIMHVEDAVSHVDNNNSLQVPQPIATIYSASPTFSQRRMNQVTEGDTISVSVAVVEQMEVRSETLEISSIAYMVLFGSSANNFVDGMSNGVAFADSLGRGLSIGIACTLAILIRSGLGLKKTLLLNLIPGGLSYLGFTIGALLDDYSESADTFVFAVSSGMYLYVFLGTLIPEMREATTELINNNYHESIVVTVLQSSGLLFGLSFIYFMSLYADKIQF